MGPVAQPSGQTIGSASAVSRPPEPTVRRQTAPTPSSESEEPAPRKRKTPRAETTTARTETEKPSPKKKAPKVEREEHEEVARKPEHETAPAPAPDAKDYKTPSALATTSKDFFNVEFGWGWYNEYYFRGVNILRAVSADRNNSGVFTAHAVLAYIRPQDAFTVGFNYWEALGRQIPKGAQFNVPPNKKDPRVKGAKTGEHFSLPPADRYAEYNINLAYTRTLIDGQLTGTFGYNRYMFSNGEFYKTSTGRAISYADETVLKLNYIGFKYVTPSISWAHDYDGFIGDFFEARLDGNLPLTSRGSISAAIRPYVSLSYDMDYNGADNGWNSVEFGADLPISLGNNLTLTFSANYVEALENSEGSGRAKSGFWGGVSLSAGWGGPKLVQDSAKKVVLAEDKPKPWEFSVGAEYRTVDYAFSHGRPAAFPVEDLFAPRGQFGRRGFAQPGRTGIYEDGFVSGQFTRNLLGAPGVAPASLNSIFQISGGIGSNAYARFGTSVFSYNTDRYNFDSKYDDEDANVSPTVTLDREIIRKDKWSVRAGFSYGFLDSSADSGYRLAHLDTFVERRDRFGFDYAIDNLGSAFAAAITGQPASFNGLVIVNAAAYANFLRTTGIVDAGTAALIARQTPQAEYQNTQMEVAKVATFVRSSVDLQSHELAIPISLRYDLTDRLHAEITVAPTLTLTDAEVKTETSIRALNDFAKPRTNVLLRGNPPLQGITRLTPGGGFGVPINIPPISVVPQLPPPQVAAPAAPPAAGGKGATPQDVDYPGKDIGNRRHSRDQLDALFGVKTQASLIFDLNEEKTVYAELWGGYHWVQEMHVSNGFGDATMDLSGFHAGIGLGFRF